MIVIGRGPKGFYWRVGEGLTWTDREQVFRSTVSAVDALGFALREGLPREYCAALCESVLDALIAATQ